MKKIRVGIVGCGAIGSYLARAVTGRFKKIASLAALADLNAAKARGLGRKLKAGKVLGQEELVRRSDFIIEAASARAVGPLVHRVLRHGKSLLVMSVGGILSDSSLLKKIRSSKSNIFLPSGALAGLDAILAARMGKITRVSLITRKPPQAFAGVDYLKRKKIALEKIKKETLLFRGPALRAVKAFPQNINVAAVLSLAGMGPAKTRVEIYAVPGLKKNIHRVEIEGDFGRMTAETENVPAPGNPKTSYLAALSSAAMLEKILGNLRIGT